jgi:hypothetical protein
MRGQGATLLGNICVDGRARNARKPAPSASARGRRAARRYSFSIGAHNIAPTLVQKL